MPSFFVWDMILISDSFYRIINFSIILTATIGDV